MCIMPSKNPKKLPWHRRADLIKRATECLEMRLLHGMSDAAIAVEKKIDTTTVWRDRQRAMWLIQQNAVTDMKDAIGEAVEGHRQHRRRLVGIDDAADPEDASGRASVHKVIHGHMTSEEELQGIRPMKGQDAPSATAQVLVFQVGNAEPKQIEEMSTEELAEVKEVLRERIGENGQQIEGTAEEVE